MKQAALQVYLKTIADQTKDAFITLYNKQFDVFEKNHLDYSAYIFYGTFFVFNEAQYFDKEKALLVFNSIVAHENWIDVRPNFELQKPVIVDKDVNGTRSFSVTYQSSGKRIYLSDTFSSEDFQKRQRFISETYKESIEKNASNFEIIPKNLLGSTTYIRKFTSRFECISKEDVTRWYQVFIFLLELHFEGLVADYKKEICIEKIFSNKVSLIFKINKKLLLRELKMGYLRFCLANSQSVFLKINTTEYPINIYIPIVDFNFSIAENMDMNYYLLKKLDVHLMSYAFLIKSYFEILDNHFEDI